MLKGFLIKGLRMFEAFPLFFIFEHLK
jgi:hypothetical protein